MDFLSKETEKGQKLNEFSRNSQLKWCLPLTEIFLHYLELNYLKTIFSATKMNSPFKNFGLWKEASLLENGKNYSRSLFPRIGTQYLNLTLTSYFYSRIKLALSSEIENTGIYRKLFSYLLPAAFSSFFVSFAEYKMWNFLKISIPQDKLFQFLLANSLKISSVFTIHFMFQKEMKERLLKKYKDLNPIGISIFSFSLSVIFSSLAINSMEYFKFNTIREIKLKNILKGNKFLIPRIVLIDLFLQYENDESVFLIY